MRPAPWPLPAVVWLGSVKLLGYQPQREVCFIALCAFSRKPFAQRRCKPVATKCGALQSCHGVGDFSRAIGALHCSCCYRRSKNAFIRRRCMIHADFCSAADWGLGYPIFKFHSPLPFPLLLPVQAGFSPASFYERVQWCTNAGWNRALNTHLALAFSFDWVLYVILAGQGSMHVWQ